MDFIGKSVKDRDSHEQEAGRLAEVFEREPREEQQDVKNTEFDQVERLFDEAVDSVGGQGDNGVGRHAGQDPDQRHISNWQDAEKYFHKKTSIDA